MIIEISIAPKNAAVNVETEKPLMKVCRYQKSAPFIKRENRPRVRRLIGSVRILIIGFINVLKSARQAPTINAVQTGSTAIPGMILEVSKTAIEISIQCKIIFI